MAISKEFLNILVCPQCKGELLLDKDVSGLALPRCRLNYLIRDGYSDHAS